MRSQLFFPYGLVVACCLLGGCARSGIVAARSVAPEEPEVIPVTVQVKAGAEASEPAVRETGTFHFPDDRGGALLAKVLPPDLPHTQVERSTEPRRSPAARGLESPSLPLARPPLSMPRLPLAANKQPLQPRLVFTETLGGSPLEPRLPQTMSLPAGVLTRVPSVDVEKPIPLPILGQPLSDRAPIEDVTSEASSEIVLAATMPQRTQPTPFVRINLPDPFEFRRPVEMPKPPPEEPSPLTGSPKLPRP